jgi:hypothetical protein
MTDDALGNAFFSIYYHCEVKVAAAGKTYTDKNGDPLDPTALPAQYKILPMPKALAAFKASAPAAPAAQADLERFVALARFTIPILARSMESNTDFGIGDIVGLTTVYANQVQILVRSPSPIGRRIQVLPDISQAMYALLNNPGPQGSEARFQGAYALVNGGKQLGTYVFDTTYQKIDPAR